jgi:hypothetical protein
VTAGDREGGVLAARRLGRRIAVSAGDRGGGAPAACIAVTAGDREAGALMLRPRVAVGR